jgi:hypothetical protein
MKLIYSNLNTEADNKEKDMIVIGTSKGEFQLVEEKDGSIKIFKTKESETIQSEILFKSILIS